MIGEDDNGRPFVRCDQCRSTLRAGMPVALTSGTISSAIGNALDRGWSFVPKRGKKRDWRFHTAKCPACTAGVCPDCGIPNLPAYRSPHDRTAHHRAMVAITEQAVQGFAPVPPSLHGDLADVLRDPALIYAKVGGAWQAVRFARVENLDEFAEIEHDATAQLLAHVARVAARSTWWTAWADIVGAVTGHAIRWSNGDPWPRLAPEVAAACRTVARCDAAREAAL